MLRKIRKTVLVVVMISMFPVSVLAEEHPLCAEQSEKTGSITVKLEETKDNLSKEKVSFEILPVATVEAGKFVLKKNFKESEVDLNKIENADELEKAAKKLEHVTTEDKLEMVTDKNGVAVIKNLPTGVYLIKATDTAAYEEIAPSLVSIPVFNEITKVMEYDVEILPKHTSKPEKNGTDVSREVQTGLQTGIEDHIMVYAVTGIIILGVGIFLLLKEQKNEKQ